MSLKVLVRSGVVVVCASLLVATHHAEAAGPAITPEQQEAANASYIFVFRDDVARAQVQPLARALARAHAGSVRFTYDAALKGFSATLPAAAAENLARNPAIKYYEKNGVAWAVGAPDDAGASGKKNTSVDALPAVPQQIPYGVARVGGPWSGIGKHAWVIDTGIDLAHADLNVGQGANFIRGKNTTNDENGHGTHVAGTIAAIDNGIDVVGVAASAVVHPVRVLDRNGSGTIDGVIAGVDYVAANAQPGDVANMSLGASGHFQSLHDVVVNAANLGIRFGIAAGNSSADAGLYEPAHVEHPNVYTVSAIDAIDLFAGFSNYGNPPVDFAAAGVGIVSTRSGGGVVTYSGTSMAAPHVSGILLFTPPLPNGYAIGDPDGAADPVAHF